MNKALQQMKQQLDKMVDAEIVEAKIKAMCKILHREWRIRLYLSEDDDSASYIVIFPTMWNDDSEENILDFLEAMHLPVGSFDRGPGRYFSDGARIYKRATGRWCARYTAARDI